MLRQQNYLFRRLNQLMDVMLALVALVVAHYFNQTVLRRYVFPFDIQKSSLTSHTWVYLAYPALVLFFQHWNGLYWALRFRGLGQIIWRNLLSAFETAGAAYLISLVIYDDRNVSRALMLGASGWLAIFLTVKAVVVRQVLAKARSKGHFSRTLLLVGSGAPLKQFIELANSHPVWGFRMAGVISDSSRLKKGQKIKRVPVVAEFSQLIGYLEANPVDEVIFVPGRTPLPKLRDALTTCEEMGIRVRMPMNFFQQRLSVAEPEIDSFEGIPVLTFAPVREVADWRLFVKYTLDRVAAWFALAVLSPIFATLYLIIKFTSPRGAPAFYGQRRCGLNGREFTCWKFRSMYLDADKRLEELQGDNEMTGPVFKMKNDPRVTPIGRFLRKTSLDELPQLWNVAMGEMSLVGPRPPVPKEVAQYDRWQRRRLSMKPGITCIWQVSGRNLIDFETWMKMDLEYIDNWSLWLDFKILARTVWVVFTGYGAM